jgi:peptidoglycan-associated lipoprotein
VVRAALITALALAGCEPPRASVTPPSPELAPPKSQSGTSVAAPRKLPEAPAPYTDLRMVPRGPIRFVFDSARITPDSLDSVDDLAEQLREHRDIQTLVIAVHGDELGTAAYSLDLSKRRAASLEYALIKRGIARGRLFAFGFGSACPLDVAHTPSAWAKNRRIEFLVYENANGCTGVPVGCPQAAKPKLPPCP